LPPKFVSAEDHGSDEVHDIPGGDRELRGAIHL
jgi:hypothetical protein